MSDRSRSGALMPFLALLFFGFFMAGSVLSHDPAQPPRAGVFPSDQFGWNLFGPPGDWLAEQLFLALGQTTYLLLAGWFVSILTVFAIGPSANCALRLMGWLILLPVVSMLAVRYGETGSNLPYWQSGGSLGVWLSAWFRENYQAWQQNLLIVGWFGLGMLLAGDAVFASLWHGVKVASRFAATSFRWKPANHRVSPTSESAEDDSPAPWPIEEMPIADESESSVAEVEIPIHYADGNRAAATPDADQDDPLVPIHRPAPIPFGADRNDYELPALELLDDPEPFPYAEHDKHLRSQAALLEKTFRDFDLNVRVVGINTGPVITQYEIALETGLRVAKVTGLADDVALNLKVSSVRMVAPIPGKNTVGVEIPNVHRAIVRLKEVLLTAGDRADTMKIPLFLGKDTEGAPLLYDLADMPHLLIAGRTGTGKSVCLNSVILSILMTRLPSEIKMLMIDPKRAELSEYGKLPHLMHPVVTDMKKAEALLSWAVDEMERRYDLLSQARTRSVTAYNQLSRKEKIRRIQPEPEEIDCLPDRLPNIVIIVDEMADLIMMLKREVEGHVIRLAQKSRAAGIHLVVATQKPTVDVITGLIKSNLPARICFQVSSRSDSRVVLDEMGADKLLGKGDMLFLQPGTSTLVRAQGTFASDAEITRIVEAIEGEPEFAEELLQIGSLEGADADGLREHLRSRDAVYEEAIEIVVREGRGSVSLLQRALGIGYGRAARLIDFMAEDGIVGPYRGSNARDVLFTPEEWSQKRQGAEAAQCAG